MEFENQGESKQVEVATFVDLNYAPMSRMGFQLRAVPSWLTVDKTTGKGDATISVTAAAWQGRNGRNGVLTVTVGVLTETVTCSQAGVTVWAPSQTTMSFAKEGATKAFTGKANLASLTFATSTDWITMGQVTVNDKQYASGAAIEGDPGATAPYDFSLAVTAAENPLNEARSGKITVNGTEYTVTQEAADATLSVSTNELNFIASGEAKTFIITTNGKWAIS